MTLFVPKPFAEIVAGQVEQLRLTSNQLSDFNVGSVVRCLLEANAVELDDYYQEMYAGLLRAIPISLYVGFGFELRDAVAATGVVTLTLVDVRPEAYVIPAGTRLIGTNAQHYRTDALVTIPSGETMATVTVTAETAGAVGNLRPHSLTGPSSYYTVAHALAISGGVDGESEEQRAARFITYILTLARGTLAALEYAATLPEIIENDIVVERVQRAAVYETPGHVRLYVHNGSYGASAALLARVQAFIDGSRTDGVWVGGYRPAGMRVDVLAMAHLALAVAIEITPLPGADRTALEPLVEAAVIAGLAAARPGSEIRPIDIINFALAVPGVSGAILLTPTASQTVPVQSVWLPAVTVTWTA